MRILDLTREEEGERVRVAATFRFEHCDLPERRVFVECAGHAGEDLQPSPDAFLLVGLPLACWMGERRVRIEGTVCSALREHLGDAMRLYAHWYERAEPVAIEPTAGFRATVPRTPRRSGVLLSGGVDSLATLRANRDTYPLEHPDAVREAIFLRGSNTYDHLEGEGDRLAPERALAYDRQIERLRRLAASADFELTVLDTNARRLYPDWASYRDIGWGAAMLSPAQMLGRWLTDVLISSSGYGIQVPPHGSHPLLDGLYSTAAVRARHALPFLGRFEKLALVAAWPEGLEALDVCLRIDTPEEGSANCGACAKCVRTMLGLVALGRLAEARQFPYDDLDVGQVQAVPLDDDMHAAYLEPMFEPLVAAGRPDLAEAVRRRIHRWRTRNSLRRRLSRAFRRVVPWK